MEWKILVLIYCTYQMADVIGGNAYGTSSACQCRPDYDCVYLICNTPSSSHASSTPVFDFSCPFPTPDQICEVQIKSSNKSDYFVIPPNVFKNLSNITILYFKFASIRRIDSKALAGTKLARFEVACQSGFLEFSFEPLEEVVDTLQTIIIDSPILVESGLQPLALRSFPNLEDVLIRQIQFGFQIALYNLPSLEALTITHNPNLCQIPSGSLIKLNKLTNLNLTGNSLEEIPPDVKNIHSLRVLDLSDNKISDIEDFNFLYNLSSLEVVYLNGNDIIMVSEYATTILQQTGKHIPQLLHLKTFFMGDNPFNCTCELKHFAVWLKDTHVDVGKQHFPDTDDDDPAYECANPSDPIGVSVLTITEKNCSSPENKTSADNHNNGTDPSGFWNPKMIGIIISIGFLFLITVGIVSGGMIYRKIGRRRNVGLFPPIDHDNADHNDDIVHEFLHDAYVSHHDNLIEFVVYHFMPRLEQEPNNLRLFLSFRDFIVGEDKLDNITKAFETCQTTIFLIDNDFVNSNQCMLELKICCSYLLDDTRPANAKQHGLILIVLDAIQRDLMPTTLRVLMDKVTYLEWDRLDDNQCWMQLEASLRRLAVQGED